MLYWSRLQWNIPRGVFFVYGILIALKIKVIKFKFYVMVANHYQVTLDCFAIIARPNKRYVALTAQSGYVVACTSVVKTSVLN